MIARVSSFAVLPASQLRQQARGFLLLFASRDLVLGPPSRSCLREPTAHLPAEIHISPGTSAATHIPFPELSPP